MGSSGILGFPKAAHRAPTISEGYQEYVEEMTGLAVCMICDSGTCPGASGRACPYELDVCTVCWQLDCISVFGHDCPSEERCNNCGHLRNEFGHYSNCSMPTMKLCDECGSATCRVNPPKEMREEYPSDYNPYWDDHHSIFDTLGCLLGSPISEEERIAEEIASCWAPRTDQMSRDRVRQQMLRTWIDRDLDKAAEEAQQRADQMSQSMHQLTELADDYDDGLISENVVLMLLRADHRGVRLSG